jgi:undecaprenyl-diphosphatase
MYMNKKSVIVILIALLALIASFYFDAQIVRAVHSIQDYYLTEFFLGVAFISSEIIIFFILTSLFLWNERKRSWIIPLWVTLALSALASFILKNIIQRERPFDQGIVSVLPVIQSSISDFSFPSAHAIFAFCAIPILSKEFPRLRYFWIAFAVIIAFSRVYLGVHFLSDVIAGALIGYGIGELVVAIKMRKIF